MKLQKIVTLALLSSAFFYGVGCSRQMSETEKLSVTLGAIKGDIKSREQIDLKRHYFISADKLTVWDGPDRSQAKFLGYLLQNDIVQVVSIEGSGRYIEIKVIKTNSKLQSAKHMFVGLNYISTKQVAPRKPSPYYMVQNIATEKIRVYKKECFNKVCENTLVLETDMVAGEKAKNKKRMTNLGSYTIWKWLKFYQTAHYPSWYRSDLPLPPKPGSSGSKWIKKKYTHMRGGMRGAFGWYTAKMTPNADGQWTHGTIGWGADKDKFLKMTKKFWMNVISDPRSHGCSRTTNESIAYIRQLLEVGTEVVKIYAKEDLLDKTLSRYDQSQKEKEWHYILTNEGQMTDGPKADRDLVLQRKVDPAKILEEGTYIVDQYPDVVEFHAKDENCAALDENNDNDNDYEQDIWGDIANRNQSENCLHSEFYYKVGNNHGNVYGLKEKEMSGVFYVDAGLVKDYHHPAALPRGGKRNEEVPAFMILR